MGAVDDREALLRVWNEADSFVDHMALALVWPASFSLSSLSSAMFAWCFSSSTGLSLGGLLLLLEGLVWALVLFVGGIGCLEGGAMFDWTDWVSIPLPVPLSAKVQEAMVSECWWCFLPVEGLWVAS